MHKIGLHKSFQPWFVSLYVGLVKSSDHYLTEHFTAVATPNGEFCRLSLEQLKTLLCRDDLNVTSEEQVFEAVLLWVDTNPLVRRAHIVELLGCIRLGMLSNQYMVERVKVAIGFLIY